MNGLRVSFEGCDNNQTLTMFCGSVIAFQGFADDLVTSVNNELQIRLNFSGGRGFLHTLRRSGGFVLLLPEIPEGDVEGYIKVSNELVRIWPLEDLKSLWLQLRYDPDELDGIKESVCHELLKVWLLSSKAVSIKSLDLEKMASALVKDIVAENPSEKPSIQDVISDLCKGKLLLQLIVNSVAAYEGAIKAYIVGSDNLITEWEAISSDHKYCLVGGQLVAGIASASCSSGNHGESSDQV